MKCHFYFGRFYLGGGGGVGVGMGILNLIANSIDPDQTPRSAASDLGLRCLLMSLLWDARLEWIKDVRCITLVSNATLISSKS